MDFSYMDATKKQIKSELTLVPTKILRGQDIISEVLNFCGYYVVIAGGFARWCMSPLDKPAPYGDIDVFVIDHHYRDNVLDRLGRLHSINNNHNAVSYDYYMKDQKFTLQFIYPIKTATFQTYGTEQILGSAFDFTVCQAFIRNTNEGLASKLFTRDETEKKLRIHSTYAPITTLHRTVKYCKLGYKISTKEMLKILYMWDCYPDKSKNNLFNKFSTHNSSDQENVIDDVEDGLY